MTLAWMLYALGVGALIAIAAVSAEWALRSAQKSVRFVWSTAIAMTLLFTLVAPLRATKPHAEIVLPVSSLVDTPVLVAARLTVWERVTANGRAALALIVLPLQRSLDVAKAAPRVANVSAGAFWVLTAVVALFVLLTVYTRSMRESRRWPRLNVLGYRVRVAPDVGPAVMGISPPEIVIPRWVLKRHADEQQLVLDHESEHVRAHDPLLLVFACVAVAVMPWNAAVWFMWSRLRLAVELDCDRRVLSRGVQKPVYGELLVELSSRRPWNSLAMPAFSWGSSHLEKRLVAMTARPVRFSIARRVASVGVIAVTSVAACNSEMPTAAQVQAMDVSALAARVPLTDSTLYFVNERAVSKGEATAVAASDIGSVEVKRATRTHPIAEVHVKLVSDSTREELKLVPESATLASYQSAKAYTEVVERKKNGAGDPRQALMAHTDSISLSVHPTRERNDSISLTVRPTRDVSQAVPENIATVAIGASDRIASGKLAIQMSDSGVVRGKVTNVSFRDPACVGGNVTGIGAADGGARIRIREATPAGVSSPCTERGTPLFVVDGVIMPPGSFDVNSINSTSIESIEVIKGAAASSLYGPRAANGVISIKLKK